MASTTLYTPNIHTIFSRDSSTDDHHRCARPVPDLVGGPLYTQSDITFHRLTILICAPCLAITTLSSGYLAWKHVRNYRAPQEQRQILRIVMLPVFYSLFNFLALCWYRTYQYVQPIAGLYESFAIAALFFLILEWVCPEGTNREKYFDEFPFKDKKGVVVEGGSLAWFEVSVHISCICIFVQILTPSLSLANMGSNLPIPTYHPCIYNHRNRHPILWQILLQLFLTQIRPPMALPRRHLHRRRRSPSNRCIRE